MYFIVCAPRAVPEIVRPTAELCAVGAECAKVPFISTLFNTQECYIGILLYRPGRLRLIAFLVSLCLIFSEINNRFVNHEYSQGHV